MNLYLLRHASAGTSRSNPLLDVKRPLDKEGKQHCLQLAQVLNALKVSFDTVVSSPLKRSIQTAQLVATETGYETRILLSTALAPEATLPDFLRLLRQYERCENLLLVGHSPNLQMFLGSLLVPGGTESKPAQVRLRKGALARVTTGKGPAVLSSLLDPRAVRALVRTSKPKTARKKLLASKPKLIPAAEARPSGSLPPTEELLAGVQAISTTRSRRKTSRK